MICKFITARDSSNADGYKTINISEGEGGYREVAARHLFGLPELLPDLNYIHLSTG